MKVHTLVHTSIAVILFITLMTITGCQTPGQVVSTEASEVCPTCENQTVTTPIKGLKYTRHICPHCKTVEDENAPKVYDEMGDSMATIHVCNYCKANIISCPQCSKK